MIGWLFLAFLIFCVFMDHQEREQLKGRWILANGKVVNCATVYHGECGINLYDCDEGRSYLCQQNVSR